MSNRIDTRFGELRKRRRAALIPFITAGDPDPGWTAGILHALVAAGADLLELGVPFSDPMADGPVIQEASDRAIRRGVSLHRVLDIVREFRSADADTPVVLMGYLNPVERYGHDAFARDAAAAGVDGLLTVDCPPEEAGPLAAALETQCLYPIRLVAPTTTPARLASIARGARGYVYYVSVKGVTGASRVDTKSLAAPLAAIRAHTGLPVAVGFGITGPDSAAAVAAVADGVVIGSALVDRLATAASAAEANRIAEAFLAPVRAAMDNGTA